jgi:23S rRNA (guanosine2251-2'-O)-methyltransferase
MRKRTPAELEDLRAAGSGPPLPHPFVFVLCDIRSALNVGAVFRVADALGAASICLCGYTACPPHREISKTALGATETVAWTHWTHAAAALDELRATGHRLVAVEQTTHSLPLQAFDPPAGRIALLFGNEVQGIDDALLQRCDAAVEIPQRGAKHSLNVAVCAGIVGWHLVTRGGMGAQ